MSTNNKDFDPGLLYEKAATLVWDYVVGFVRLEGAPVPTDAESGGSGTLIEIDGNHAILSADHVLEPLVRKKEFGLIVPDRMGSGSPQPIPAVVKTALTKKIQIGKRKVDGEGPDLAVLFLYDLGLVGSLKAKKSFHNLPRNREQILAKPHPINDGVWLLLGFAKEWKREVTAPDRRLEKYVEFNGKILEIGITKEYVLEEFDYLAIKTKYPLSPDTPASFKGYSGGGVWQVLFGEGENGEPVITDHVLSGVAFSQSLPVDGVRTVTCHGRQSIYRNAIDRVRK